MADFNMEAKYWRSIIDQCLSGLKSANSQEEKDLYQSLYQDAVKSYNNNISAQSLMITSSK
jgi:hypothetical protein